MNKHACYLIMIAFGWGACGSVSDINNKITAVNEAPAAAKENVTVMGDYTTDNEGWLKFSLLSYTKDINLTANFNDANVKAKYSNLRTIRMTIDEYEKIFEADTSQELTAEAINGFVTEMKSEIDGNNRTVTLVNWWKENPDDVKAFEATLTIHITAGVATSMDMVYMQRFTRLFSKRPRRHMNKVFEGSTALKKVRKGLGLYGMNHSIKLGRIQSISRIKALVANGKTTEERLMAFCDTDCPANEPAETLPVCGNGKIEPGEDCDGENMGNATCLTFYDGGTLKCSADCLYDWSQCTLND